MRVGVDAMTGQVLTGWAECEQAIGRCIRTRVGSCVMRRQRGSRVVDIQDDNASAGTIMDLYVAVAEALNDPVDGEPGYNLTSIELVRGGRDGRFVFLMSGDFFPLGYLGDFSVREARTASIPLAGLS